MLVLALLFAPDLSALRSECDLCPPDCPMHHQGGSQNGPHLGCHHGASHGQRHMPDGRPALACANCGNHGLLADGALPPMLLAPRCAVARYDAVPAGRMPDAIWSGRGFDRPETPPPIAARA